MGPGSIGYASQLIFNSLDMEYLGCDTNCSQHNLLNFDKLRKIHVGLPLPMPKWNEYVSMVEEPDDYGFVRWKNEFGFSQWFCCFNG